MENWFYKNIIYLTKHGSQCYGLNTDLSDLDIKGICIPPISVENDLFHRFEQAENDKIIESTYSYLKNPNNPKLESTVFSLRKFILLAAEVNPNIIELLYVDSADHLIKDNIASELIDNRDLFLSAKAKFCFAGYSFSQLAKIERHRKWIVLGDVKEPNRSDYGLPPLKSRQTDEIFGYIKSEVEKWNLSKFSLDDMKSNELKETIWELILHVSNKKVSWDNWPQAYEAGVVNLISDKFNLKEEVVDLLNKEREYKKAKDTYYSWLNWKETRNKERAKLEEKSKYDTKHASHLVRLLRMGYEILTEGKVIVKRPDRDEILSIKNGGWTYDKVMEYAQEMQIKLDEAYKTTKLPKSVDKVKINELYHKLYNDYHNSIK